MQGREVLGQLFPKPFWFPLILDHAQQHVRVVRYTRADYFKVPFLDRRGIRDGMRYVTLPWADLQAAVPDSARSDSHWIFQISHVGSTLLSRLVGELGGLLPYREPLICLSALGLPANVRAERLGPIVQYLSRTFEPGERAVVKATSTVGDIAAEIMARTSGQAIALRMAPERYVAARLVGNLDDLRNRGELRRVRLEHRSGRAIDPAILDQPALLAAMSWACEASAHEVLAAEIAPERLMFVDFDRFLDAPAAHLERIADHFGVATSPTAIERIVEGPTFQADSKLKGKAFDVSARAARLDATLSERADEIRQARAWLDALAAQSTLVASAVARTA